VRRAREVIAREMEKLEAQKARGAAEPKSS
jgi:hypothetical protein